MNNLLALQLLTSFIVGGLAMAVLSIIAERASARTAGVIISLPTTLAIGFFFIGWAVSPEKVSEAAVIIPAMEGVVMIFTLTYLYLSKIKISKIPSMILCTIGSIAIWFLLTIILVKANLTSIYTSLLIYFILNTIAYYFITYKPHPQTNKPPLKYNLTEKIIRTFFSGGIISLSVYLSKTLGPIWGVVFSAFPAVFISTMTIVYWHYNNTYLFKLWKNSPVGSTVFVIYALVAMWTFPNLGLIWGTLVSYLASLLLMLILIKTRLTKLKS